MRVCGKNSIPLLKKEGFLHVFIFKYDFNAFNLKKRMDIKNLPFSPAISISIPSPIWTSNLVSSRSKLARSRSVTRSCWSGGCGGCGRRGGGWGGGWEGGWDGREEWVEDWTGGPATTYKLLSCNTTQSR